MLTSEITKIKKKIKVDHALAMELWNTGDAEARILALLIADHNAVLGVEYRSGAAWEGALVSRERGET